MKKLRDLYPEAERDVTLRNIRTSSLEVEPGDLFVCISGISADRHAYADDAIRRGAAAIIASKNIGEKSVPVVYVKNTDEELPSLAERFYDAPEKELKLFAVTGTDGKTTTSTIIQQLIGTGRCGYIGTNGVSCDGYEGDSNNTTPDIDKLYEFFRAFRDHGCDYVSMEVSSDAYYRNRVKGILFDCSVFTNITPEHLNTHKSFENYKECKKDLFRNTKKDGVCVINRDAKYSEEFMEASAGKVLTYGKSEDCDLQIVDWKQNAKTTDILFRWEAETFPVVTSLLGEFNVYNLAGAFLALLANGYSKEELIPKMKELAIDGRVVMLKTDADYYVMVDYAHTPNGIQNIFSLVNTLGMDKIYVVIGAAGTRDPYKRPDMGKAVCENPKTYGIFTYEDPRTEEPADICADLTSAIQDRDNFEIVLDRGEAIEKAVMYLKKNEIALILGKGNEDTEELRNGPIHFNDIEEAYKAIKKKNEQKKD
ncbi:MAG: UDP-N-acetylmuramoyl-L-alanyl-D-glutamate--2,6-diaminopimelate ligase [Solobacterium sp.]|nr:UDP-N-acetylmuramoyl-L-alanyl-D-glutamate--2,6-diaminopimelate ligase [Solobacterium sp.]